MKPRKEYVAAHMEVFFHHGFNILNIRSGETARIVDVTKIGNARFHVSFRWFDEIFRVNVPRSDLSFSTP